MSNLQNLHDYYLSTKPNTLKVQSASNFLIRLCKQLGLDSPEEVTPELYHQLPETIDIYYRKDFHKAIQDKSILAEMIGRFGPRDGWDRALDVLLADDDSNLRQFTFQSLDYSAKDNFLLILPYIEKYKMCDETLMIAVAARIMSSVYSDETSAIVNDLLEKWKKEGAETFLSQLKKNVTKLLKRRKSDLEIIQPYFDKIDTLSK